APRRVSRSKTSDSFELNASNTPESSAKVHTICVRCIQTKNASARTLADWRRQASKAGRQSGGEIETGPAVVKRPQAPEHRYVITRQKYSRPLSATALQPIFTLRPNSPAPSASGSG